MAKSKSLKSKICSFLKYKCCLFIVCIPVIVLFSVFVIFTITHPKSDIFSNEKPLAANDSSVVQYLRHHHLIPPSSGLYNFKCAELSCGTRPCMIKSFNKIKKFVLQLLENKRNGFFVESGSNNGEYMSGTIYLEEDYNWTGLLIEPDPVSFNESKKVNRKAWLSNTCISKYKASKPIPILTYTDTVKFYNTGESHKKAIKITKNAINDPNPDKNEKTAQDGSAIVIVECFPLYTYLLALKVTQIDFLSLNIAGSLQVLKHFPFDKIILKVLKIEVSRLEAPIQDLIDFLKVKNLFPVTDTNSSNCVKDYLFAHTSLLYNLVQ